MKFGQHPEDELQMISQSHIPKQNVFFIKRVSDLITDSYTHKSATSAVVTTNWQMLDAHDMKTVSV